MRNNNTIIIIFNNNPSTTITNGSQTVHSTHTYRLSGHDLLCDDDICEVLDVL